jgi:predicted metal-dependent phosphoesterase TrpH
MIDLHSHSNYSDGHSTVTELLIEAERKNISLISITDHNTIKAYDELEDNNVRNLFGGEIVNGVEITTTYNGEVIEILGYNFDLCPMRQLLDLNVLTFEQKQMREFELIKNKYLSVGVKFDINNIVFDPKKESSRVAFCNEIKKYPENNKFFLYPESIYMKSGFTRNEVYNPKSPLYVDQSSLYPSLEKTIEIIHQAGGISFLAHLFVYSKTIVENLENIINRYDIDGLECFYTTFTDSQTKYLLELCALKGLFKCGGSDYHGTNKINHDLGIGAGNLKISENTIQEWYILKLNKHKNSGR